MDLKILSLLQSAFCIFSILYWELSRLLFPSSRKYIKKWTGKVSTKSILMKFH